MIGRSGGGNPVKALGYITGAAISDEKTGEVFNFMDKSVEEVRILLPCDAPGWAKDLQKLVSEDKEAGLQLLSNIVNAAEKRVDGQVYREIEFSLPRELTFEQNKKLAEEYVQDQFCGLGMLAIQSFHVERCEKTDELNPHCHTFLLTRELTEDGLSIKKNRDWNERSVHEVWREQWAQYASFHLKMHGYDITLDHRSYADQGLDIEPQAKLGKGVKEQERRAKTQERVKNAENIGEKLDHDPAFFGNDQGLNPRSSSKSNLVSPLIQDTKRFKKGFIEDIPATNRMQELRSIQLRNLYRIIRRPETVLDIVTRHHSTFMWGDVQKILGRYVDEPELFQRLDARLRSSNELILLKMEGVRDQSGRFEERSVYTTRSMLRSENALVGRAEDLASNHSHGVSSDAVEAALERMETRLQREGVGHSLSEGQRKAIEHLVGEGQLKCVVGYAGAGKTTALEACRDIWESSGYKVYGLAPTGRAAQNLEGSGISSQTLHKFLKSFEEGRCQYNSRSVLVLDEGGMVNVERFDAFLRAVKALGVKAVVVGDGAQLQPVEAGPAFRLVTEKVGVSRLEEVVRQKQDWQREATVLFGKQESQKAIQTYQERGHIHLIEEPLSKGELPEDVLARYEVSARTSGLIFREIMKEINKTKSEENAQSHQEMRPHGVSQHQDYPQFLKWKEIQKEAAKEILEKADGYREALEERGLNPLEVARLFVDKKQDKASQYKQAAELLKTKKLGHLIGVERSPGLSVEVRSAAKAALIEGWKEAYHSTLSSQGGPGSLLMMAYSNKDVRDLNSHARSHLKALSVIGKEDVSYTITREVEDDFGRRTKLKEIREFSKGDRIVFTRNNKSLGVKNGSMGTIMSLDRNKIEVVLDKGSLDKGSLNKGDLDKDRTMSFSPNLFSFFDQGWAVTIHKSQGTTIDKSFILASHEMNQNLTYVAMTRHREDVHVYGSTLDFWRPEKVAAVLSKSGEKLGAADYLDAHSLSLLMKDEDKFLDRLFTRLSDELHAMGAVSKRAFGIVADHFLGRSSKDPLEGENLILLKPEALIKEALIKGSIREEDRANEILQKTREKTSRGPIENNPEEGVSHKNPLEGNPGLQDILSQNHPKINQTVQDIYEDWKHPAFKEADFYKRVFEEGLKVHGEESSIQYWNEKREPYMKLFNQKIEQLEKELKSPLLSYMSNESRDLARKAALEDPDRALSFLTQLKGSKQAEQDAQMQNKSISASLPEGNHLLLNPSPALSATRLQEQEAITRNARETISSYLKFKELHHEQRQDPYDLDLKKELRNLSKDIYKNKEMFEHIKGLDPEISKVIKEKALEKTRERKFDHGGFSL
jgi:ATP-dependent exoDNAse (exonuclease V) alpha subunit